MTLELCVGNVVVAQTRTAHQREDIAAKLGTNVAAGFAFTAEHMRAVAASTDEIDDQISVRIAGVGLTLAFLGVPATVADVLDVLRAELAPPSATTVADLEMLLDSLRTRRVAAERADFATVAREPAGLCRNAGGGCGRTGLVHGLDEERPCCRNSPRSSSSGANIRPPWR